jgi:multiple sugar transport system permease protein
MKTFFKYAIVTAALLLAFAPVYWLFTISIKTESEQFSPIPRWVAFESTLRHYQEIVGSGSFTKHFVNSLVVGALSTLLALLAGVPAAYSLSRLRWPAGWTGSISSWILSQRLLPPIVTVLPLFLMMRSASLLDSLTGLILVYAAFNLPFVIWMMRGFFDEVPRDLEEAALLDGESRAGALWRILLPVVRPGIAATAVFCLIAAWNEFLFALILAQTDAAMTLPVGIAARVTQYEIRWGAMSAGGILAIVPVLIFAALAQRHLVRGLSFGSVKG